MTLRPEFVEHRVLETISRWLAGAAHSYNERFYNKAAHSYKPAQGLLAALEDAGLEVVEKKR